MFATRNDISIDPDVGSVLAANLRRLRIARHLSLSELGRATSIGKATLSAIENGNGNPTVGTLTVVAAALRVPIGELLDEPPLGEIRLVRAHRRSLEPVEGLLDRSIGEFAVDGTVAVSELALPPRQVEERKPGPARSREEVFVLEGTVIAGPLERITELVAGDYASFPADVPRSYESGRDRARVLLLVHPAR